MVKMTPPVGTAAIIAQQYEYVWYTYYQHTATWYRSTCSGRRDDRHVRNAAIRQVLVAGDRVMHNRSTNECALNTFQDRWDGDYMPYPAVMPHLHDSAGTIFIRGRSRHYTAHCVTG